MKRTTCASSWPACAGRSKSIRPSRATCSPSRASATGWRENDRHSNSDVSAISLRRSHSRAGSQQRRLPKMRRRLTVRPCQVGVSTCVVSSWRDFSNWQRTCQNWLLRKSTHSSRRPKKSSLSTPAWFWSASRRHVRHRAIHCVERAGPSLRDLLRPSNHSISLHSFIHEAVIFTLMPIGHTEWHDVCFIASGLNDCRAVCIDEGAASLRTRRMMERRLKDQSLQFC